MSDFQDLLGQVFANVIYDQNVEVGENTKIWHFSHISEGAKIGKNCNIGQNVFVGKNVAIGDRCKIQNNVFIPAGVTIEDDVFIGPSVTFTNVVNPRAFINRKSEFKETVVKTKATIGAGSTILCGITISPFAMIGAGSVVVDDVLIFQLVFGNPARVVGKVNEDLTEITYY